MWHFLLLLLPWICLLSNAATDSHLRAASATALKFKCDSLPHRSYFEDNICYFAVQAKVKHGDAICSSILTGAKMRVDRERWRILGLLYLDPSTYHDTNTVGQSKNMLCSLEMSYTCQHGQQSIPGKCVIRSEQTISLAEASNFCHSKGARSVLIHNEFENKMMTGILGKLEASWILPKRDGIWSAENKTINYWNFGQSLSDLICTSEPQQAILTRNPTKSLEKCSAYGQWQVDSSKNRNIALCINDADCPFCPAPPEPETTTTSTTTTTTTLPPCHARNDPPRQRDLWELKSFVDVELSLTMSHFLAATPEGLKIINRTRKLKHCGFHEPNRYYYPGTISDEGYKRLDEVCCNPEERKHIVKMWFTINGNLAHHIFEGSSAQKQVYVGYVSIKAGACGSNVPMKKFKGDLPPFRADIMYAVNDPGERYEGRVQDGGRIQFWLWDMNERKRDAQRKWPIPRDTNKPSIAVKNNNANDQKEGFASAAHLWNVNIYFHYSFGTHAYCADEVCFEAVQRWSQYFNFTLPKETLGRAVSESAIGAVRRICPLGSQNLRNLAFEVSSDGFSYVLNFEGRGRKQGWVATVRGACGAQLGIKKWKSKFADEMLYAVDHSWDVWYEVQDGGKYQFYMWN